jgi:hypothetical protein
LDNIVVEIFPLFELVEFELVVFEQALEEVKHLNVEVV